MDHSEVAKAKTFKGTDHAEVINLAQQTSATREGGKTVLKRIAGILRVFVVLVLCTGILFFTVSCIVQGHGNNGQHKGWNKNSNNPHHPNTTNPGKSNGKPK